MPQALVGMGFFLLQLGCTLGTTARRGGPVACRAGVAGGGGTDLLPAHGVDHDRPRPVVCLLDHQIAAARTGQVVFAQSLKAFKFSTMACEENEPCETIITPPKMLDNA